MAICEICPRGNLSGGNSQFRELPDFSPTTKFWMSATQRGSKRNTWRYWVATSFDHSYDQMRWIYKRIKCRSWAPHGTRKALPKTLTRWKILILILVLFHNRASFRQAVFFRSAKILRWFSFLVIGLVCGFFSYVLWKNEPHSCELVEKLLCCSTRLTLSGSHNENRFLSRRWNRM